MGPCVIPSMCCVHVYGWMFFFAHTLYIYIYMYNIYICIQDQVLTLKPQWSQIREGGLGFRAVVSQFQPLLL